MKNKAKFFSFMTLGLGLLLTLMSPGSQAQRLIALTIDDLPFVGEQKAYHLNRIIETLQDHEIPATGFVIGREVNATTLPILEKFRDAGLNLGNHTFTHANLNHLDAEQYIREIELTDHALTPLITEPRYFRYPYLAMGQGEKKSKVSAYLRKKHYEIAPISIDSRDFVFNQLLLAVPESQRRDFLKALKVSYLDFIWQQTLHAEQQDKNKPQILLIHANLLNAYTLQDIINLYIQHGYTFISLEEALDPQTVQTAKKSDHKMNDKVKHFLMWD